MKILLHGSDFFLLFFAVTITISQSSERTKVVVCVVICSEPLGRRLGGNPDGQIIALSFQ